MTIDLIATASTAQLMAELENLLRDAHQAGPIELREILDISARMTAELKTR